MRRCHYGYKTLDAKSAISAYYMITSDKSWHTNWKECRENAPFIFPDIDIDVRSCAMLCNDVHVCLYANKSCIYIIYICMYVMTYSSPCCPFARCTCKWNKSFWGSYLQCFQMPATSPAAHTCSSSSILSRHALDEVFLCGREPLVTSWMIKQITMNCG